MIAKLVAGREKDFAFADALVQAGLIDPHVLEKQPSSVPAHFATIKRIGMCPRGQQTFGQGVSVLTPEATERIL
ncbi:MULTISPECIES: hypothetical protein [unclassified Frankia]|uniref:hypothetical protein n=1 Tax=unclassified Frankia TaxID=2632575 RepID=UPI0020253156